VADVDGIRNHARFHRFRCIPECNDYWRTNLSMEVDVGLHQYSSNDCLRPSILLPRITALVSHEPVLKQLDYELTTVEGTWRRASSIKLSRHFADCVSTRYRLHAICTTRTSFSRLKPPSEKAGMLSKNSSLSVAIVAPHRVLSLLCSCNSSAESTYVLCAVRFESVQPSLTVLTGHRLL
jgi:hypothetical protein